MDYTLKYDHALAGLVAANNQDHSNLARCYIELSEAYNQEKQERQRLQRVLCDDISRLGQEMHTPSNTEKITLRRGLLRSLLRSNEVYATEYTSRDLSQLDNFVQWLPGEEIVEVIKK